MKRKFKIGDRVKLVIIDKDLLITFKNLHNKIFKVIKCYIYTEKNDIWLNDGTNGWWDENNNESFNLINVNNEIKIDILLKKYL